LADPAQAVAQALEAPMDAPPLSQLARGRGSACIVISDITRPVPNRLLLEPILAALEAAGLAREKITILIATGTHRPNEGAEAERLVGPAIARGYRLISHRCTHKDEMSSVGTLAGGVDVLINKTYLAAELKILTGFIEPHMWAGYSGGRKSILPGISSLDTVKYLHGPRIIAHPNVEYGVLEGNPFHEAALAAMAQAGADFIVNVTLDGRQQITRIFAGHPVAAHLAGCNFLADQCIRTLDAPLDFILTTNAGAPLDCNLYQTTKGMIAAAPAVKPGGVILIASACFEGAGSADFQRVMDMMDTPQELLARLMAEEFFIPDQWCAQEICQVLLRNPVWLHTAGIEPARLKRYHFQPVPSIENAVTDLLARFGPDARWAVAPEGPMVILRAGQMS
jgi:nickel-dependent lactate racemase